MKTAVVAAPIIDNKYHRHSIWNNRLSEMNFYDAIIIHSYATVIKGEKEFGQMLTEITEGDSKYEAFEIYKNRALEYLDYRYPKEVKTYTRLFNKPIWVTEWNLQISWTTGNTMLQSLFVTSYFLELVCNDSLQNITLTTYHNMGGRDYSGSIFRINNDFLETQSTYYPLRMIGNIFNVEGIQIKKVEISKDIFQYLIYSNNQLNYSCFINWGNINKVVNIENNRRIKLESFFSNNLFDKANEYGRLLSENIIIQPNSPIKINANSITLISYLDE